MERKTCPVCGKRLSAEAFNGSAKSADGLARICRACTNARRRQRDQVRKPSREPVGTSAKLALALRQGDIAAVRKLTPAGMQPCWDWICEAMRGGHLDLAQALLADGAERNVFTIAAVAEVRALSRRLRRNPADASGTIDMAPNSVGVTPLHIACASCWSMLGNEPMAVQVRVVEMLHEHGADVNAAARYRGIEPATPLFSACWTSGNRMLVQWLLDHGAHATEADLLAALGHFQRHGREAYDIAELLLKSGVPVDGSVPGDRTPLQGFAHVAAHKTVAWLIAHGADVNAIGPGGRTAAHFAAERNTGTKTLELLVHHGADLTVRDDNGHTPLDIAKRNEKTRLVDWIQQRVRSRNR